MSRPEKEIDWDLVDRKLIAGCLGTEIAPFFDMHVNTFYDRVMLKYKMGFTAYCQQKRALGDSNIREVQYNKALEGDNTMLIWLGKNRLKQSEAPQEISVSPETLSGFNDLMGQLSSLQSSLKNSASTNITDNKS